MSKAERIIDTLNKMCLSKANLSEEEANRIITKEMHGGRLLYYYKCKMCSSHHLTSLCPTHYVDGFMEVV